MPVTRTTRSSASAAASKLDPDRLRQARVRGDADISAASAMPPPVRVPSSSSSWSSATVTAIAVAVLTLMVPWAIILGKPDCQPSPDVGTTAAPWTTLASSNGSDLDVDSLVDSERFRSALSAAVAPRLAAFKEEIVGDVERQIRELKTDLGEMLQGCARRTDVESRLSELGRDMDRIVSAAVSDARRAAEEVVTAGLHQQKEEMQAALRRETDDKERDMGSGKIVDVNRIVADALQTYDADKTGLFDYALETAGGTIASTRCTELYDPCPAIYSVMGIPVWRARRSPRTILRPGTNPGECWSFRGAQGAVVVQLAGPVKVGAVTVEHMRLQSAPEGANASAPRRFAVFGLNAVEDASPVSLGNFTYDNTGSPVQTFYLEKPPPTPFSFVELKVLSNHGSHYTCIYRFRVHGKFA